mmetsp:Transcript_23936/g.44056  ORF Transcript_23936/g.44056 Transcript_23936/m.44056 type:complete len:126 (+) Transcript_23936:67-444(+)
MHTLIGSKKGDTLHLVAIIDEGCMLRPFLQQCIWYVKLDAVATTVIDIEIVNVLHLWDADDHTPQMEKKLGSSGSIWISPSVPVAVMPCELCASMLNWESLPLVRTPSWLFCDREAESTNVSAAL